MSEYDSLKVVSDPPSSRWYAYLMPFSVSPFFLFLCLRRSGGLSDRRVRSASEPGFCLTQATPIPSFLPGKRQGFITPFHQELTGSPKFLCASLHTCHALRTPAVPPESRHDDSFVSASVIVTTSPTALIFLTALYHASGVRLTPCGLHNSLCTLRAGRSTVCLSFPRSRNTRYGRLAKPYPAGTCTLQEAPSFVWRTNN